MAYTKACIQNLFRKDDPAIDVMFNPEEYTLSKDINYAQAAIPGLRSPLLQFVHGQLQTLDMELLVDTYEAHGAVAAGSDARIQVERITSLMTIDSENHAPPPVMFTWGTLSFTGVLSSVSQRYVMFLQDGTPVRARLQVSFSELINPERASKEENLQTANFTKIHVATGSDRLSSIAMTHYENPQSWRPIAIANELDDPRSFVVGQSLRVPSLPFTDPESGERVA